MGLKQIILNHGRQVTKALGQGVDLPTRLFLTSVQAMPDVCQLPVQVSRVSLNMAQAVNITQIPTNIEDREIPGGPNKGFISIRVVTPKRQNKKLWPVVMYFHGGGWVLGGKETHDRLIRNLAVGSHSAIVFVDYHLSPETKFPVAIEEAYVATKMISEHGKILGLDPSRIAVAGDSSGGNMAAAVTFLAKERGGPHLRCQVLFYPVTDSRFDTPSYLKYAKGYFLTAEAMRWYWTQYLPDKEQRKKPTASPLQASLKQLKGLPPALVITADCDVLRDEGEAYAKKLTQAGVSVDSVRFKGTIHSFTWLAATENTRQAKKAIALACNYLQKKFCS